MKLDLSEFSLREKYSWLEEAYGDYTALQMLVEKFQQPGVALEKLALAFSDHDEVWWDDLIAFHLAACTGFDALTFWIEEGYDVEHAVNELLVFYGLDEDEGSPDGFGSYSEYCGWRSGVAL